jgi:hypothetical protein
VVQAKDVNFSAVSDLGDALLASKQQQATSEEFGNELERRLGTDWWTLPEAEIRDAATAIATSRGHPEHGASLGDWGEKWALSRLVIRRLGDRTPNLEWGRSLEGLESAFLEVVQERYGGMTPLAEEVGRREFNLEL